MSRRSTLWGWRKGASLRRRTICITSTYVSPWAVNGGNLNLSRLAHFLNTSVANMSQSSALKAVFNACLNACTLASVPWMDKNT